MPEFIQKQRGVPFPADEQGLGRAAGGGPAAEEGIKIGFGDRCAERPRPAAGRPSSSFENGNQDSQIDALVVVVPVEICRRPLLPTARLWVWDCKIEDETGSRVAGIDRRGIP